MPSRAPRGCRSRSTRRWWSGGPSVTAATAPASGRLLARGCSGWRSMRSCGRRPRGPLGMEAARLRLTRLAIASGWKNESARARRLQPPPRGAAAPAGGGCRGCSSSGGAAAPLRAARGCSCSGGPSSSSSLCASRLLFLAPSSLRHRDGADIVPPTLTYFDLLKLFNLFKHNS